MKASMVFLGLAVSVSSNIIFTHVPLTCNLTDPRVYHGCLRGQYCTTAGECIPRDHRNPAHYLSFRPEVHGVQPRDAPYSKDGFCGPAHGNTVCDPNSKVYTGVCCSQYGSCGNTIGHCGAGCLFGCTAPPTGFGSGPRSDGQCGSKVGGAICDPKGAFGGCCSQYGFCGSTPDHCLVSNNCQNGCTDNTPKPPTTQSNPSPTGAAPRSDGQCGSKFGGSTCEPQGPYGGCCSQYGFCGKTDGHCLVSNGCQNGCRDGNPAAPIVPTSLTTQSSTSGEPVIGQVKTSMAAEATATARVTTDGTCGGSKGNTVCGNWVNGNCCSMYGFCGKTSAHCGAGCQSGNCLSSPAVPVAGPRPAPAAPNGGTFRVVGQAGVPAMHAGLMPNGRVIFLDKVENYTQLRLANGHYAMSAEYDPVANTAVPLEYSTNAFCSGGTFLADGRMISVGGNADLPFIDSNIGNGLNAIRYIGRSSIDAGQNGKSWSEPGNKLASARWYATAQTMPDGTVFVASGSLNGLDPTVTANNNPTYEILNPDGSTRGTNVELGILKKNQPYYMYPFVHLLSDGTLFLFTSKASQVFNVGSNTVAKDLPDLPGDYRTYPNTGGSVLLPLSSKNNWAPDIVICGGGAYQDLTSPTDPSCGRIQPLTANAQWEMDYMPEGRGMVEGTLLPDGTVIWMNGGSRGAQGFGLMDAPATEALLYDPAKPVGQRFSTLARSDVPRLYHSVCLLLLDGTVMVAGSNPVEMPILQPDAAHPYVTEWRVENYVPPYLQGDKANQRPTNVVIESKTVRADGSQMIITFIPPHTSDNVKVVLYHGGFVTHSVHMGHRMLNLDIVRSTRGGPVQTLYVIGPPSRNLAPPGPYVLYVLVDGVPGVGRFVQVV